VPGSGSKEFVEWIYKSMKNIRLYEEFTGGIIPKESDLANEISEFLDITEDFQKKSRKYRAFAYVQLGRSKYSPDKVIGLIKLLTDNNYKIDTFPKLDEKNLKAMLLTSRIDYSDPFEKMEYGVTILVDCEYKGVNSKACITITPASLTYKILGKGMEEVSTKEFNENNIDMLFWNGEYLVTGKFEHTDTYREDGMTSLTFESYETSDNKNYVMSAGASGSWNAGYDLEEIEDIDFL
jgi:hypothetical protein